MSIGAILTILFSLLVLVICESTRWYRVQKREKQARLHVEETLGQELLFTDSFCGTIDTHRYFNMSLYEDCFIADGYIMNYSAITEVEYYAPYGQRKAHFYVRFKERFRGKFCSERDEASELWPFLKSKCEKNRNSVIREY